MHKVKFKKWKEQILETSKELEKKGGGCSNKEKDTHKDRGN